jgi:hypothetical protein
MMAVVLVQKQRIGELKKKNQELEKFKFVLDYKVRGRLRPNLGEFSRVPVLR